jgi:hypothetical protein
MTSFLTENFIIKIIVKVKTYPLPFFFKVTEFRKAKEEKQQRKQKGLEESSSSPHQYFKLIFTVNILVYILPNV